MRLALLAALATLRLAAADSAAVLKSIDNLAATYGEASQEIWRYAELGFQEAKSSALLQRHLRDAGFTVTSGAVAVRLTIEI
jgi:aminobenzoyl-glutamate utilization protein B